MKAKELINKAQEEITKEKETKVVAQIKESLLDIESGKKTLKSLEQRHDELLDKDIDEF